jgi:molecular chaperone DnaK (HSP70)
MRPEKAAIGLGIDLGTSNSSLAILSELGLEPQVLDITQPITADATAKRTSLPSAIYIPHEGEVGDPRGILGTWARERGAELPDRLISSAKSWLCQSNVDRRAAILPWQSEVPLKYSPVEASQKFLVHLLQAFETSGHKPYQAKVVLTVPASFDDVARQLTHEAAVKSGLKDVTLLEEPQAAFYAWLSQSGDDWRSKVKTGDLILVVDVGGGTSDFSLIALSQSDGNVALERISVGDHLLLGGDNMDLALGYLLRSKIEAEGKTLDSWQFLSLVHQARMAKEVLLSQEREEYPVAIASRGSSIFGKTIKTSLTRVEVQKILVDGFFPLTPIEEMPRARRTTALQEYGLPYVADAGISRHLAKFLTRSLDNVKSDSRLFELVKERLLDGTRLLPNAILFNGGVFNARPFGQRVLELLHSWGATDVKELTGTSMDLAVAKGAAYYAKSLAEEKGIRIKAGTSRSYYLGIEPSALAVPGLELPVKGWCVVPQGVEEGSELTLPERQFGLVTGEEVAFRFFSSSVRAGDKTGEEIENAEKELEETSTLSVTLPSLNGRIGELVPVSLEAKITEVGTLALRMKHTQSDQRWNLEFNVRATGT